MPWFAIRLWIHTVYLSSPVTNRVTIALLLARGSVAGDPGWRSSTAEQLICNQQVVGSSPIASSRQKFAILSDAQMLIEQWWTSDSCCLGRRGEVPEWPKGADCKSAGYAFEGSNPSLSTFVCGNSSVCIARAFQARGRGFESRFPLQFVHGFDGG